MFAQIISALQGDDAADDDAQVTETLEEPPKEGSSSSTQEKSKEAASAQERQDGGLFTSFWAVASSVAKNVQQSATELATTITETDWKSEIATFTADIAKDTHQLRETTSNALEHIPQQASTSQPATTDRGMRLGDRLKDAGGQLSKFGTSFVVGSRELFDQAREAIETELNNAVKDNKRAARASRGKQAASTTARYSRLDAEVAAMQRDSATYCDEPSDAADFAAWQHTFRLQDKKDEIDAITRSNAFMAELQSRIVPLVVEYDVFWTRYFYRLHKLQQKHEQMRQLASRVRAGEDDEFAWDDDDASASTSAKPARTSPQPSPTAPPPTAAATAAAAGSVTAAAAHDGESANVALLSVPADTHDAVQQHDGGDAARHVAPHESAARMAAADSAPQSPAKEVPHLTAAPHGASTAPTAGGSPHETVAAAQQAAASNESAKKAGVSADSSPKSVSDASVVGISSATSSEWCLTGSEQSLSTLPAGMATAAKKVAASTVPAAATSDAPQHTSPSKDTAELTTVDLGAKKKETPVDPSHEEIDEDWGSWD